jgi:hypothetical protein
LFFWDDFKGSIKGGSYYGQLLTRPLSKGWLYLAILVAIGSVIVTVPRVIVLNEYYNQTAQFIGENFDSLQFSGGAITNMPPRPVEYEFDRWIIRMDDSYRDTSAIRPLAADASSKKLMVFVGPRAAYLSTGTSPSVFNYPASFTSAIVGEKMMKAKIFLLPIFFIIGLGLIYIIYSIASLVYVVLIGLMIVFKFRAIGISYKNGFHLGLYLVTLQFVISLVLDMVGINLPYAFLWYIIMYILYVGLMVNISRAGSVSTPFKTPGPTSNI